MRLALLSVLLVSCAGSARPACPDDVPSHDELSQSVRTSHFAVEGTTPLEIRRSMVARMPQGRKGSRDLAVTNSEFCTSWALEGTSSGCRLVAYRLVLHLEFVMPKWTPPPGVAQKTIDWWNEDYALIAKHEQGHAAISIEGAKKMVETGTAIREAATCAELGAKLQRQYDVLLEEIKRTHDAYDAEQGTLDHL